MATVTGDIAYDFSGLPDGDWSNPDFTVSGLFRMYTGILKPVPVDVTSIATQTTASKSSQVLSALGEFGNPSNVPGDDSFVGFLDANNNGYVAYFGPDLDRAKIRRVDAGVYVDLALNTAVTYLLGDQIELTYDTNSGALDLLINGTSVLTATDTTHASAQLQFAFGIRYGNNRNRGWISVAATGFGVNADVTAPVLSNGAVTPAWKAATIAADTDTGEGTMAATVYLASEPTDPAGAEVINGSYANAVANVSAAVAAAGTITLPDATGLQPNTAYKVAIAHRDVAGNIGTLAPIAFSTLSATMTATLTGAANLSALDWVVFDSQDLATAGILAQGAGAATDAAGQLVIDLNAANVADGQAVYYVVGDVADANIAGGPAAVSIA